MLKQINEVEGIPCKAKEAGEFLKLFCQTPKDVRSLVNFLDKKGKEYFVIAERAEKPVKVVIKGLPIDTDLDHIKTELTNLKYRVDKVNQLKKYKTREPLKIFQVHLLPTENIKEIYNLKALRYTIISVEPYENKQSHQCFNCQLWNHGSKGCRLNPKCVVCAGDHASKECPNKGKPEVQVKCTNCNGPHTANYRGCPKYPKNIQRNGRAGLNKVQPGRSFAAVAKSHEVNKPTPQSARAPHPQFGENVTKQIPPPRVGRTGTRPSPTEVNDPFPVMGQSGLNEKLPDPANGNEPPRGTEDIDAEVERLTAEITTAFKESGSWRNLVNRDVTEEINQQVKERNRCKKIWQKTRHPADKNKLNRAQKHLSKLYREYNEGKTTDLITGIGPGDDTLWKLVKTYKNDRTKMPPLITANRVAYRDIEKAEAIADNLALQFQNNDLSHPPTEFIVERRIKLLNRKPAMNKIKPCTPAEVADEIAKLKNRKCPGKDRITNLMLKHLPKRTIVRITYLINCVIKLSHFPKSWKTAVVVPIYKAGKNAQSPDSYRPISLLSSLSKLAESIILNRLEAETEDKLIPFQFGFRKGLSTTEQLLRMTEHIREGFDNYFDTAAVFIDIAKAFDRVWIDGLIYKLHKLKISKQMILLLQSYLKNREFIVRVGNELSTPRMPEAGVVQGSRLGPHCFNIFINDICQTPDTQICLFADDTAIMCTGPVKHINVEKLNNHLAELEKWLIKWKIKINKDKCQA
ncbi:putative RNA-directed DNA polymerase from transposon BS, partial [Araneus ventricosus]